MVAVLPNKSSVRDGTSRRICNLPSDSIFDFLFIPKDILLYLFKVYIEIPAILINRYQILL